jgi:hypothetical protein
VRYLINWNGRSPLMEAGAPRVSYIEMVPLWGQAGRSDEAASVSFFLGDLRNIRISTKIRPCIERPFNVTPSL